MRPIIDARNPALWRDVPPSQIWSSYAARMEQAVTRLFGEERQRPIVSVRESPPGPRGGERR